MPNKIEAWECAYCGRYRKTKASISRHEKICFQNPDRKIIEWQLAIFETLPRELTQKNSYGVDGSEWIEPIDFLPKALSEKYKWWPRDEDGNLELGYIYINGEWTKIDGYKPPKFAPGHCWKDEFVPDINYLRQSRADGGVSNL